MWNLKCSRDPVSSCAYKRRLMIDRIGEDVLMVVLYTRFIRCSPIKDEQDCLCLHSMSSFLEWIRSGNILCHSYPPFSLQTTDYYKM